MNSRLSHFLLKSFYFCFSDKLTSQYSIVLHFMFPPDFDGAESQPPRL